MLKAIICGTALLAASAAAAQDRPATWLNKPRSEDINGMIPALALKKGVNGKASIRCQVTVQGLASNCTVINETPAGYGFGLSALSLSPTFVFKPAMRGGQPVAQDIVIPIDFNIPTASARAFDQADDNSGVYALPSVPWLEYPSPDALAAAFPRAAVGAVVSGHVVLRCGFKSDGGLRDCQPVAEQPGGRGFAKAAQGLAPLFKASVGEVGDKLTRLRYDLPIHFIDPQSPEWKNRTLAQPVWKRTANLEAVNSFYPPEARAAGMSTGRGVTRCRVARGGRLTECQIVREEPAGMGFGAAAGKVAELFVMNPWTTEGLPADGGSITMPIRLELPTDEAPPNP